MNACHEFSSVTVTPTQELFRMNESSSDRTLNLLQLPGKLVLDDWLAVARAIPAGCWPANVFCNGIIKIRRITSREIAVNRRSLQEVTGRWKHFVPLLGVNSVRQLGETSEMANKRQFYQLTTNIRLLYLQKLYTDKVRGVFLMLMTAVSASPDTQGGSRCFVSVIVLFKWCFNTSFKHCVCLGLYKWEKTIVSLWLIAFAPWASWCCNYA